MCALAIADRQYHTCAAAVVYHTCAAAGLVEEGPVLLALIYVLYMHSLLHVYR